MKMEEKFLSAIGDIEDDFISEAAACTPAAVKKPKNLWLRYGCGERVWRKPFAAR